MGKEMFNLISAELRSSADISGWEGADVAKAEVIKAIEAAKK